MISQSLVTNNPLGANVVRLIISAEVFVFHSYKTIVPYVPTVLRLSSPLIMALGGLTLIDCVFALTLVLLGAKWYLKHASNVFHLSEVVLYNTQLILST